MASRFLPILMLCVLLCGFAAPAMAQSAYRNFIWGVSPQDVKKFEKAAFYKEENGSLYFLEMRNKTRVLLRYDFQDGKLWRARHEYVELFNSTPHNLLSNILAEEESLSKIYGSPVRQQLIWKDDLYKNYPQFWGRAYGSRDLRFETQWQKDDTQVVLESYRNANDPYYTLGYTVTNAKAVEAQKEDQIFNVWQTP
jgi:hypothetical protein